MIAMYCGGEAHYFERGQAECRCHGKTMTELTEDARSTIPEIPTAAVFIHPTPPEPEELTPIPTRRVRSCYYCSSVPATVRAKGEPAMCEQCRYRGKR